MSLSRLASRATVGTIARFGSAAAPNCASRACVRLQPCAAQAPFAHGTRSGAVVPARTLATKGRISRRECMIYLFRTMSDVSFPLSS